MQGKNSGPLMFFLRGANFVLFVINIGLAILWFSLIRQDALPSKGEASEYVLSHLTLQITILAAVIAIALLAIGALAIFGFSAILERAEDKADKIAREVVSSILADSPLKAHMNNDSFRLTARRAPLPDPGAVIEERE